MVLVTGGAGFIGSHLVDRLIEIGANVVVVDNLKDSKISNLSNSIEKIEFHKIDVRDYDSLKNIENVEVIFHLAANANVPYSFEDPEYDFTTNALGTFNILKMCLNSDVNKLVYASSAAVYGEPEYVPIDEKHHLAPISPYGASKLAGEQLGFAYFSTYGVPFIAVRIFNTYGERQQRYVMYDLIQKLKILPNKLEVLGTGMQVRDFCYVRDTVDAIILVAEQKDTIGEVYNIGTGIPTKIGDLAEKLVEMLGLRGRTHISFTGSSWKGDIVNLYPDISKIRSIGFKPKVTLDEGLKKLLELNRASE